MIKFIISRIFLLTICLSVVGVELEARRAPGSFVFQADNKKVVEAYKLAVKVIEGNIKPWQRGLLTTTKPSLMAGKGYASPWTRDASYNTFFCAGLIYPQVAKNTLLSVLIKENGTVRIGGQYWDCVSWITGAWAYYLYTGDREFLDLSFDVAVNSLAYFREREFDKETGLFCGPGWSDGVGGYPEPYNHTGGSSFILDYAKHNKHVDKIRMKALSTNCLYCNAYRVASLMGKLLKKPAPKLSDLAEKSMALKAAINRRLWIEKSGRYAYFLDVHGKLDHSHEGLGHAHAILFGIADSKRAERILRSQHVSPHGIPCTWPLFPRFSEEAVGRHCGTVWPQIQGFWALAAASCGRLDVMDHEFRALTDMALASNDFREIYHPETGKPYGGMQTGRLWRSEPGQTWAATAYIAMIYQGIIGMRFDSEGIEFHPLVPQRLGKISLSGIKYRSMNLDIRIIGSGTLVKRSSLDGKPLEQPAVAASLVGHHVIEIHMAGSL